MAVTQTDNDRAMDAEELAELYKSGANVVAVYKSVPEVDLRERRACKEQFHLLARLLHQFSDALVK